MPPAAPSGSLSSGVGLSSAQAGRLSFTPADAAGLPALSLQLGRRAVLVQGKPGFPTATQTHVALVLDAAASRERRARALTEQELATSHSAGPDPAFLE